MPRSIWKGSISFGLVDIPVALFTAESKDTISFNMLDRKHLSPIRYKRVSEKTGHEVAWEDIVKGYEYEKGSYVVLTDEDFARANPKATQTIEIVDFVDAEDLDAVYFETPYYLQPTKKKSKGYVLLREALEKTGKVGIAKVVIRTKEHLAAVMVRDEVLVLELLRYGHEVKGTKDLDVPTSRDEVGITAKEIAMAETLVESMSTKWDPEKYRDTYQEDLMKMIETKVETGSTESLEEEEEKPRRAEVVDLTALLKESLEKRKGHGARERKPAVHRKEAAEAPKRRRAAKTTPAKRRLRRSA